jgi:hypothetical protein
MRSTKKRRVRKLSPGRTIRLSKARLDALIEEATVDAYNEAEQVVGLFTMMEDNLQLPFETEIFGLKVTVERIDMTEGDEIVAVCKRSGKRQKVPILDLSLPSPPPEGAEWIAAYRYWRRGLQ